jgi:topoisomerase-4 subunit B
VLRKILQAERERKELSIIENESRQKANLHNKKLRDCRAHLPDTKIRNLEYSFITGGDSASGSITNQGM